MTTKPNPLTRLKAATNSLAVIISLMFIALILIIFFGINGHIPSVISASISLLFSSFSLAKILMRCTNDN